MDASAYNMSFDKEQLSVLCANYDRRIDALAEENAKLREQYYAYEYKMDGLVSRLTGGLLSKSAATPNDVLYSSVVEELTEDHIKENFELEADNAKLREAVATAIKVQAVLCGDADMLYCRKDCTLHRQESDDCLACDVIGVAQELGIEVPK